MGDLNTYKRLADPTREEEDRMLKGEIDEEIDE